MESRIFTKKSYYDKAISYFKDKVDIFLIFSDNLEYCRQTFNNTNYPNIKFIIIRKEIMWIYGLCHYVIIIYFPFFLLGGVVI